MRRLSKLLGVLGGVLVVLLGAMVLLMRSSQGRFEPPRELKPGILAVDNGTYFFGAKVGAKVVLFDAGIDPAGKPVDGLLAAFGASRADVREVFLTHGHGDHTGGARALENARIRAGAGDVDLAACKVSPEATFSKVMNFTLPPSPVKVTDPLSGPADIAVGEGRSVKALPMPGHTAGSYAYLYDGVLFVGDTMAFQGGKLGPIPGLFEVHPDEVKKAVLGLKPALAGTPVDIVCTAHGGCTPAGEGQKLLDALFAELGG